MPIALEIYDDDPDDVQYMVVVIMFSDRRCVVIFVTGRMSLEECNSFVQAFEVSMGVPQPPPDKNLYFEHHTTVRCNSEGYTLLGGMPKLLEYFRQRFVDWEFTDEYTYNLHRHILRQYSMVR